MRANACRLTAKEKAPKRDNASRPCIENPLTKEFSMNNVLQFPGSFKKAGVPVERPDGLRLGVVGLVGNIEDWVVGPKREEPTDWSQKLRDMVLCVRKSMDECSSAEVAS